MLSLPLKRILAALALLGGLGTACADATLSETEFTRFFIERARQTLPDFELREQAPLQLIAKKGQGHEQFLFLGNSYAQYQSGIESLERVVEARLQNLRHSESLLTVKGSETVMAVIKPVIYRDTVHQQLRQAGLGDKPFPLLYRQLNEELLVFYVFDQASGVRMITPSDLKTLQLDAEGLHQLALANLARYFGRKPPTIKSLAPRPGTRLYLLSVDEFYESSLLLLPEYWRQQRFELPGEPVVFVPARHLVLVAGSEDAQSLQLGADLAAKGFAELGYAISPRGYRLKGTQWSTALP
jgi:uncharacterized protein YtpQ (UPF0354 family)